MDKNVEKGYNSLDYLFGHVRIILLENVNILIVFLAFIKNLFKVFCILLMIKRI